MSSLILSPIFEDYRQAVRHSTEACDEYHDGVALCVAGTVLGRLVSIRYGMKIYPNFYMVLVGATAITRKTTAMRYGADLLHGGDLLREVPEIKVKRGVSSAEGLIRALGGHIETESASSKAEIKVGKPVLLIIEEYASLLKKARQDSTANLIPIITELFDSPYVVDLPRVKDPLVCYKPLLSIMSGTTPDWLENAIKEEEILGGFSNRFVYFTGVPKDPISLPKSPVLSLLKKVQDALLEAKEYWTFRGTTELSLDDKAARIWDKFYTKWHETERPDLIQTLSERIPEYTLKTALVMAALEKKSSIGPADMLNGIKMAYYWEESLKNVFGFFAFTEGGRVERRIFKFLSQENPIARSELHQKLGGKTSARDLDYVLSGLASMGRIANFEDKRGVRCIKLVK